MDISGSDLSMSVCGIQLQILGERVCVVHYVRNVVMVDGNVVRKA